MSDEDLNDAEQKLDDEALGDEDLDEDALDDLDDVDLDDDEVTVDDDDVAVDDAVVAVDGDVPTVPDTTRVPAGDDEVEDEDVLDLDEELHPDDVEAPLDTLLQERTASATLEDEEEELEEEEAEAEGDDRGEGPTRIVPRRPGEFVCRSCFLVLPRHQLADEERMLCRDCA